MAIVKITGEKLVGFLESLKEEFLSGANSVKNSERGVVFGLPKRGSFATL